MPATSLATCELCKSASQNFSTDQNLAICSFPHYHKSNFLIITHVQNKFRPGSMNVHYSICMPPSQWNPFPSKLIINYEQSVGMTHHAVQGFRYTYSAPLRLGPLTNDIVKDSKTMRREFSVQQWCHHIETYSAPLRLGHMNDDIITESKILYYLLQIWAKR